MKVEHGPASEDGDLAPLCNLEDAFFSIFLKLAGRVALRRVKNIDEVVRDPFAFRKVRFGRAYVHSTKHQGRIHTDDLAPKALGQLDSQT